MVAWRLFISFCGSCDCPRGRVMHACVAFAVLVVDFVPRRRRKEMVRGRRGGRESRQGFSNSRPRSRFRSKLKSHRQARCHSRGDGCIGL